MLSSHGLNRANLIQSLNTCSKERLLSCLSLMEVCDLKELVFSSWIQTEPENKAILQKHSNGGTQHLQHIQQFFRQHTNTSHANHHNPFCSLPVSLGSYILSFSIMSDRINQELICRDLYQFAQIPMAKYHLVIDHKFGIAIYNNAILIQKCFNAQFMEIRYGFYDGHYEIFEDKYYSFLAKIVSKSPLLHTIKYDLQYGKIRTKLFASAAGDESRGHPAHLLQCLDSIAIRSKTCQVFHSVTNIIWKPSQFYLDNEGRTISKWRKHYDVFCKYLPNLRCFTLQNSRIYGEISQYMVLPYDDTDCLWNIFKEPFYYNKLQHIYCNMTPNKTIKRWSHRNIKISNHPLSHLYHFKNLKSLHLKLPIYKFTPSEIWQITSINIIDDHNKFMFLSNISLEFERKHPYKKNGAYAYHIERLCAYIFSRAPNVTHYKCMTNGVSCKRMLHLLGHYDRLESLETDSSAIIPNGTRMLSLKRLTVHMLYNNNLYFDDDLQSKYHQLGRFPNLETFKCIYTNYVTYNKWHNMNRNIEAFIQYITKQTNNSKLKNIGIHHKQKASNSKVRWRYFSRNQFTMKTSLALCKSITDLSANNLFDIHTIELCPVGLRQKELRYLYFWFIGNGNFSSIKKSSKNNMILSDVYVYNNMPVIS